MDPGQDCHGPDADYSVDPAVVAKLQGAADFTGEDGDDG
jgi:hypothetical protein